VKNNFLKNGFYNTSAGIIRIGLAILTIPLLIRLIGIEDYGQ
jgi:O-antigen/teichoic acid export membrane protein